MVQLNSITADELCYIFVGSGFATSSSSWVKHNPQKVEKGKATMEYNSSFVGQ